ncbi:ferredoxin--NADP reductase [Actinomadura sp. GC306]|uniref:ferredoxin--NADP reductase n=1 Tax=Actinomadura sp. GC306 TaxID=2530367 RepID=UPI0010439727|nr:ferredoxin--NADP reductase [Actinomadura sp. GC306]TDC71832.1 ferredoxin--NADP reductase [Actinomadura sp. GC306]
MAQDHGFHPVRIKLVIQETADTRTFVLDAPFSYRAGQFLTIKICGTLRSYSMSSSPATDADLMTTVKRVPGGLVSNWMHDNLEPGDVIETTRPAGAFCLRETSAPLVALCGGSGITPILSLVKTALAATERPVRILAANRDASSIIFAARLAELAERHPGRLEVRHHLDDVDGLVTEPVIREFTGGDTNADFYLCGPQPFMDLCESALLALGADRGRIFIERFTPPAEEPSGDEREGTVTIVLNGRQETVAQRDGETVLQSARRAGLSPPFSCESGHCATCMARVTEGEVKMRVNDALEDDEVAEGWVLTCQGEPAGPHVTVVYED